MKLLHKSIISLLLLIPAHSQTGYLANPPAMAQFVDSCADFWYSAWDDAQGGFYTNVNRDGSPLFAWGRNKNMISQSRNAYGLVRAYQMTGNIDHLNLARAALDFMWNSAWDATNNGWYNEINENGNVVNSNETKSAFYQHYAILGLLAYWEVTRDSVTWERIEASLQSNENNLWHDSAQLYGYYDYADAQWSNPTAKSFNATVDAITTHLLQLYLLTDDTQYLDRLNALKNNIKDYLFASMPEQSIGFAEKYQTNWTINEAESMTIMGHVLKTSWCVGRIHQLQPNPEDLQMAEDLFANVVDLGYDHHYGGPYKDYNRQTGQMLMWGNPDTAKAWWQMEQAITGGLMLYDITGDDNYLEIADESLAFFMNHFVDPVYGEVYENRTRDGRETWGLHKGTGGKAGYHSIELGYYVYLYGQLYVHDETATLKYNIQAHSEDRWINVQPIPWSNPHFRLQNVQHETIDFVEFDPYAMAFHVPAGLDGEFEVTFTGQNPTTIASDDLSLPQRASLGQNYPNPFNPQTRLEVTIKQPVVVSLKVFDSSGRLVATLADNTKLSQTTIFRFNGEQLASGIYFANLQVEGQAAETRKMMLIR
jgi:mannose/cellobiose epimerase-like protein (N-acyl-D-glucosamine 2-epimerase family)